MGNISLAYLFNRLKVSRYRQPWICMHDAIYIHYIPQMNLKFLSFAFLGSIKKSEKPFGFIFSSFVADFCGGINF